MKPRIFNRRIAKISSFTAFGLNKAFISFVDFPKQIQLDFRTTTLMAALEKTSFTAVEDVTPSTTTMTASSISSLSSRITTPITNPPAGFTTVPMPTPSLPLEKKTASPSLVRQPMNSRFVSSAMGSASLPPVP